MSARTGRAQRRPHMRTGQSGRSLGCQSPAPVNAADAVTGETPLHSAPCSASRGAQELVVRVLLAHGADATRATRAGVETGSFMQDCRTRAETPPQRAAAFGTKATIELLIAAGARLEATDINGDSPSAGRAGTRDPMRF